jgi:signal transduction histidine kinase
MAQGVNAQVHGDERLVRRAIRNLLENARRYGGDEVEAIVSQGPGYAELRVCDRGPGVPDAYRERIFEAFFRLPGHAEREGGVGLGLSLVRQIAERHGGRVRCEAREGGGSCFVLHLPTGAGQGMSPRSHLPGLGAMGRAS